MSLVLTKAALALKNAEDNFKVVKFESHKPKKKAINSQDVVNKHVDNIKKDVDLKKIRHEIVKFGMSGFDPTKKEEAKIALAVSLGAKPPRRKYINYKDLMEMRKKEKLKQIEEKKSMIAKSMMNTGIKKKKPGNAKNDVGHLLSNYGKVNKNDLKKDSNKLGKKKKK